MKMNLDITKPGESKPIFCQFLAPSFYCSPAVPGSSSRSVKSRCGSWSVQTSEKSAQAKKNGRKGRTCKRLYKHLSPPTSRKTASRVRMSNVKMSKFAVLEAFRRSPTFFLVSACAKRRRDVNKNVVSKVNLRFSSLYRDYSYPLTLSNKGEPS